MPNIPTTHEAYDLLISFSRQPGPSKVKEPKGHKPCGSPSTAPQRHNPQPRPHKLPLALAKPNSPSSGFCHDASSVYAEPIPGLCQPTCHTTPTVAPQ
ncbi:hypothetical protein ACFXTI_041263 [Malus domestica]